MLVAVEKTRISALSTSINCHSWLKYSIWYLFYFGSKKIYKNPLFFYPWTLYHRFIIFKCIICRLLFNELPCNGFFFAPRLDPPAATFSIRQLSILRGNALTCCIDSLCSFRMEISGDNCSWVMTKNQCRFIKSGLRAAAGQLSPMRELEDNR